MDLRAKKTAGIVLRARNLAENDRLLILLTKDFGKIAVVARGSRRPNSSLRASAQPFTESDMIISETKGLPLLTQATVTQSFPHIREGLEGIAVGSYMGELLDYSLDDGKTAADLYSMTVSCYILLNEGLDAYLIRKFFDLNLLKILGYLPQFDGCQVCRKTLRTGEFYLVARRGGLACSACISKGDGKILSLGTIKTLEILLEGDLRKIFRLKITKTVAEQLDAALDDYMDYYLPRSEKARKSLYDYLATP